MLRSQMIQKILIFQIEEESGRKTSPIMFRPILVVPDYLFASALSKHSARPIETITPLSEKIGVPIDSTITGQDYPVLAEEILNADKYEGRLVLVCWHHGNIPGLALALGGSGTNIPNPWNPIVFNLILNLRYDGGATPVVTPIVEPF
jgi:hypothetical protein